MTILVTGGAGFIGSHLCEVLVGQGHEVICLDNLFTGRKRNIAHLFDNRNFEFIRHDITEPILLEADQIETVKGLIATAESRGVELVLPVDVIVATAFSADAEHKDVTVDDIEDGWMGLDIGPNSRALFADRLADDDSEASDLFRENADLFRAALGDRYPAIDQSIRNFDFEVALRALRAALVECAPAAQRAAPPAS